MNAAIMSTRPGVTGLDRRRYADELRVLHPEWSVSKCIRTANRSIRVDPLDARTIAHADPTGERAVRRVVGGGRR